MAEFQRVAVLGGGPCAQQIENLVASTGRHVTSSMKDLAVVDLVIETAPEDDKRRILEDVAAGVSASTVVVTTTATMSVTELASVLHAPGQVAGLHFLDPALDADVVEVVGAVLTEDDVLARLSSFVEDLGKTPIPVGDRPGFLINRLFVPYLNDVVQAYDDGLASAEDLDTAIRLGLGYERGPLELLDAIGLDVHEQITSALFDALHESVFSPPPLLRAMIAAGQTGATATRGFHESKDDA